MVARSNLVQQVFCLSCCQNSLIVCNEVEQSELSVGWPNCPDPYRWPGPNPKVAGSNPSACRDRPRAHPVLTCSTGEGTTMVCGTKDNHRVRDHWRPSWIGRWAVFSSWEDDCGFLLAV